MSGSLRNRRVLVTRPSGQARGLIDVLIAEGATVLHRPALSIQSLAVSPQALQQPIDWLVFASPNAVRHGLALLRAAACSPRHCAAVGPGTARAAIQAGLSVDVAPSKRGGADDLLAQPGFKPQPGECVVIMAGRGGRRRLQNTLTERGIKVVDIAVYARLPAADCLDIPSEWRSQRLDASVVTSVDGLHALISMADAEALAWLHKSRLVTVSQRVADAAAEGGFSNPAVAAGASDQALVQAVEDALESITI